ncbi:MAG: isoaspartyl peptidase/L-asparaginase [Candidatus Krumholzibacteriia bacterium]
MSARPTAAGRTAAPLLLLALLAGCAAAPRGGPDRTTSGAALPATWAGGEAHGPLALTHGGVGSPPEWSADCQRAAGMALLALEQGGAPLDAAVLGTLVLEDHPRFNAGTGANIRLDGRSIQMDAAVMTSEGRFGAVAVIERVRNPVAVARALLDTPHLLLAGEGATRFAHAAGFADELPTCPEAEVKYRQRVAALLGGQAGEGFETFDWRRYWNYPGPIPAELAAPTAGDSVAAADPGPHDTVGTVARGADGRFAATLSTGGTSLTLYGRVGDVPIYGAGCYAGPAGAVACTGFGEEIIRHAMARTVYDLLADGVPAREAVRRGCAGFPPDAALGLIAVDAHGWGVAANRTMAYGQAATAAPFRR